MGFWDTLFGTDDELVSTFSPEQKEMMKKYMSGLEGDPTYQAGNSYIQRLLSNDPSAQAEFNQPYIDQFNQQTVPKLTNQFAGMGTGAGGLNSSGFQNSIAQAGRGLSTDLAALRSSQQMQAAQTGLNYAQSKQSNLLNGLNLNTQQVMKGHSGLIGQGLSAAGGAAAYAAGGPAGTAASGFFSNFFGGGA